MKVFRLLASSDNTNSFGLRGHILVAPDGEAWEVGVADDYRTPVKGLDYVVPDPSPEWEQLHGKYTFEQFACARAWELPSRLLQASAEVVASIWPSAK